MHHSTRIRRGPILAAIVVVAVMLISAAIGIGSVAQAQPAPSASAPAITPGYTACGVEATGIDPTYRDKANPAGKTVTAARPGMAVSPAGRWFSCQPWVPQGGDPRMPEPAADKTCPARDTFEVWEVAGRLCTSVPPGEYTGGTTKLAETKAGRVRLIVSNPEWVRMGKSTTGSIVYRCVARPDGSVDWQAEPGATCRWATE